MIETAAEPKVVSVQDKETSGFDSEQGSSSPASFDADAERRLVRKLDLYLIPVYVITYMVSFIDRVNIGNAQVAGLVTDLGLEGTQFNVAVSIFYVTYIVCEIPLTVLLKIVGPSKMIPMIMISWSFVTAFSGFVQSYAGLVVCRLILGICEAALFPSLNVYVAMFWKREEIAKRASLIFVALALAGAFGGLLAYGLVQLKGVGGYNGWRWLFFVEGMLSFVVGIASIWLYPDAPESAYFLNEEERKLGKARLVQYGNYEEFSYADVKAALMSPMCWLSGTIQMFGDTFVYSMTTFLPTILNGMGFSSLQAQYLTVPVYITGALGFFGMAWIADKTQRRAPIILFFGLFTIVGYAILLGTHTPGVNYFACFLIVFSAYVYPGLQVTWINGNTSPHYKRATAVAMNQTVGNIGGVIAGQIYLARESPHYVTGHSVSLACCVVAWLLTALMWWDLGRRNQVKQRAIDAGTPDTGRGDESLHFRYQL